MTHAVLHVMYMTYDTCLQGEAPRALFQGSRFVPTIKRALYNVWANHRASTVAADDLAAKLVQVRGGGREGEGGREGGREKERGRER